MLRLRLKHPVMDALIMVTVIGTVVIMATDTEIMIVAATIVMAVPILTVLVDTAIMREECGCANEETKGEDKES